MATRKRLNSVGMHLADLETPVLLVDLAIMERNIEGMASFFSGRASRLRPHTKTHKTPALAHKQIEAGAIGICAGSLDAAESMISAGISDVLVTREVVSPQEVTRAVHLARHSQIMIIVDEEATIRRIAEAACAAGARIRILVDINTGLGRSGVLPGEPALKLSRLVAESNGLKYMGLMGYAGSFHSLDAPERERREKEALSSLVETKELIEKNGIEVPIVSAGATSTFRTSGTFPGVTEVQAGTYITMDTEYASIVGDFEIAISVLTTVVSRPTPTAVTTDAGMKKFSGDAGLPRLKDSPDLRVHELNEEHGRLVLANLERRVNVGDKLELLPSHGCTTFNLYDELYGMRDGKVEVVWDISGRGT